MSIGDWVEGVISLELSYGKNPTDLDEKSNTLGLKKKGKKRSMVLPGKTWQDTKKIDGLHCNSTINCNEIRQFFWDQLSKSETFCHRKSVMQLRFRLLVLTIFHRVCWGLGGHRMQKLFKSEVFCLSNQLTACCDHLALISQHLKMITASAQNA